MKCLQLALFYVTNFQWEWHLVGNHLVLCWTLFDSNWNFVCVWAITFWLIFWGFAILLHTQKGLSVCCCIVLFSLILLLMPGILYSVDFYHMKWNGRNDLTVCKDWNLLLLILGCMTMSMPLAKRQRVSFCLFCWLVFSSKTFCSYMWCQPFCIFHRVCTFSFWYF